MTMRYEKLVAVTPVKNEEEHIFKCVNSVLNQTYPITLYVIVDDYSDDRTRMIVEKFNDRRIHLIFSGLKKAVKQHGLRPHLVQQIGINEVTKLIPDWKYLLLLDGDCWIPTKYCEKIIQEMKKDPKLAMGGAMYLKTPKGIEKSGLTHVRSANHIIRREFYNECLKSGKNYATLHGELLLERFAWINGWKVKTFPIVAYCGRETGITVKNPFLKGIYDYKLGTPLINMLISLRANREKILKFAGWTFARISRKEKYFSKSEIKRLHSYFYHNLFKKLLR